jgi:hypothetical protein
MYTGVLVHHVDGSIINQLYSFKKVDATLIEDLPNIFPNQYVVMKKAFDRQGHERMVRTRIKRFAKEYADQKQILELYDELARFMRDNAWPTTK